MTLLEFAAAAACAMLAWYILTVLWEILAMTIGIQRWCNEEIFSRARDGLGGTWQSFKNACELQLGFERLRWERWWRMLRR